MEKVRLRRSAGEGPPKKVHSIRFFFEEGLSEKRSTEKMPIRKENTTKT